jgi:hypothetical protein
MLTAARMPENGDEKIAFMSAEPFLLHRSPKGRAMAFCQQYGLRIPILQAPTAGSCPVNLAVADAGGLAREQESTLIALRSRSSQSTSPSYLDRISGSPEHMFSNPSKPIYRAEPARF